MIQNMAEPKLYQSIQKFKTSLLNAEKESAIRLVTAYGRIYQNLQDRVRALEADIVEIENPTPAQVGRLTRYRTLLSQTADEMNKYAAVLDNEVAVMRTRAVQDATNQARQLVQQALPNLPIRAQTAIMAQFDRLPKEAVTSLLGALQKGSPLNELLNEFGNKAALELGNTILQGVAAGYNPRKVAAQIEANLGGNLSRALTISRTEMLRAYRTASLANYAANSDVVKGWRWMVTKQTDSPPCLACLALDGRQFGTNELFMKAHPNCRCAPEPVSVSYKDMGLNVDEPPGRETGKQWFDKLSETEQKQFFSKAGWDAYKSGKVSLDDFIGLQQSKDWGDSYVEKSLKEIQGAK